MRLQIKINTLKKKAGLSNQQVDQVLRTEGRSHNDLVEDTVNNLILDNLIEYQRETKTTAGTFIECVLNDSYLNKFEVKLDEN